MYERSYMHRDTVTHVAVAGPADFILSASVDGHLKFWRKTGTGVEFAKHFRAHLGPVTGLAVSPDGALAATISVADGTAKVFDVATFDMVAMARLPFPRPGALAWGDGGALVERGLLRRQLGDLGGAKRDFQAALKTASGVAATEARENLEGLKP